MSRPVLVLAFGEPPAELIAIDMLGLRLDRARVTLTGAEGPEDLSEIVADLGLRGPVAWSDVDLFGCRRGIASR